MKKRFENEGIKQLALAVLLVLAAGALITGTTMAWFTNQYRLSSAAKIHPPAYISIRDPGDTVIQSIDLSYDKSEIVEGTVTLQRPFVIRSERPSYDLCIAHTTNISGLHICLFQAEDVPENTPGALTGIASNGKPYCWEKVGDDLFDSILYINKIDVGEQIADPLHQANFETFRIGADRRYDNVQKNAEPLYWVKKGISGVESPNTSEFYTNYILEISWAETDKETDILYVIAQAGS